MHRTGGEYADIPVSDQACGGNQCLCNRTGGKSVIHNPIIVGESDQRADEVYGAGELIPDRR